MHTNSILGKRHLEGPTPPTKETKTHSSQELPLFIPNNEINVRLVGKIMPGSQDELLWKITDMIVNTKIDELRATLHGLLDSAQPDILEKQGDEAPTEDIISHYRELIDSHTLALEQGEPHQLKIIVCYLLKSQPAADAVNDSLTEENSVTSHATTTSLPLEENAEELWKQFDEFDPKSDYKKLQTILIKLHALLDPSTEKSKWLALLMRAKDNTPLHDAVRSLLFAYGYQEGYPGRSDPNKALKYVNAGMQKIRRLSPLDKSPQLNKLYYEMCGYQGSLKMQKRDSRAVSLLGTAVLNNSKVAAHVIHCICQKYPAYSIQFQSSQVRAENLFNSDPSFTLQKFLEQTLDAQTNTESARTASPPRKLTAEARPHAPAITSVRPAVLVPQTTASANSDAPVSLERAIKAHQFLWPLHPGTKNFPENYKAKMDELKKTGQINQVKQYTEAYTDFNSYTAFSSSGRASVNIPSSIAYTAHYVHSMLGLIDCSPKDLAKESVNKSEELRNNRKEEEANQLQKSVRDIISCSYLMRISVSAILEKRLPPEASGSSAPAATQSLPSFSVRELPPRLNIPPAASKPASRTHTVSKYIPGQKQIFGFNEKVFPTSDQPKPPFRRLILPRPPVEVNGTAVTRITLSPGLRPSSPVSSPLRQTSMSHHQLTPVELRKTQGPNANGNAIEVLPAAAVTPGPNKNRAPIDASLLNAISDLKCNFDEWFSKARKEL